MRLNNAVKMYLGRDHITKAYHGNRLVWMEGLVPPHISDLSLYDNTTKLLIKWDELEEKDEVSQYRIYLLKDDGVYEKIHTVHIANGDEDTTEVVLNVQPSWGTNISIYMTAYYDVGFESARSNIVATSFNFEDFNVDASYDDIIARIVVTWEPNVGVSTVTGTVMSEDQLTAGETAIANGFLNRLELHPSLALGDVNKVEVFATNYSFEHTNTEYIDVNIAPLSVPGIPNILNLRQVGNTNLLEVEIDFFPDRAEGHYIIIEYSYIGGGGEKFHKTIPLEGKELINTFDGSIFDGAIVKATYYATNRIGDSEGLLADKVVLMSISMSDPVFGENFTYYQNTSPTRGFTYAYMSSSITTSGVEDGINVTLHLNQEVGEINVVSGSLTDPNDVGNIIASGNFALLDPKNTREINYMICVGVPAGTSQSYSIDVTLISSEYGNIEVTKNYNGVILSTATYKQKLCNIKEFPV